MLAKAVNHKPAKYLYSNNLFRSYIKNIINDEVNVSFD